MKIDFYVRDQVAAFAAQVERQKVVADALPRLLEEIGSIDVQQSPEAAQEAGERLYKLCAGLLQTTPEVLNSIWLLRQVAAQSLLVCEDVATEKKRREAERRRDVSAASALAEAEATELREAVRLRELLAKHPA